MATATMTSKGQITVPKEVRDELGLVTGSKVMFVKLTSGHYRLIARTGSVDDFIGMAYDPTARPLTIADMDDAIAEGGAASGTGAVER